MQTKNKLIQLSSVKTENDIVKITHCFPSYLREKVRKVVGLLSIEKSGFLHAASYSVQFHGETLEFPYRVYFNEPRNTLEKHLTEEEQVILDCIFLRHHNGYIRQRRLERLIDKRHPYIVPFTFQLLGECIKEILMIVDDHINEDTMHEYLQFMKENKKYAGQTENRMISYWDLYYRTEYPKRKRYIGQKTFDRLKKELKNKEKK
jgi:hypothetical protein